MNCRLFPEFQIGCSQTVRDGTMQHIPNAEIDINVVDTQNIRTTGLLKRFRILNMKRFSSFSTHVDLFMMTSNLGLSKSEIEDHFWTVLKVIGIQEFDSKLHSRMLLYL